LLCIQHKIGECEGRAFKALSSGWWLKEGIRKDRVYRRGKELPKTERDGGSGGVQWSGSSNPYSGKKGGPESITSEGRCGNWGGKSGWKSKIMQGKDTGGSNPSSEAFLGHNTNTAEKKLKVAKKGECMFLGGEEY